MSEKEVTIGFHRYADRGYTHDHGRQRVRDVGVRRHQGLSVNAPPHLGVNKPMPGLAIVKTRHIAELKIYVERCIGWHNVSNPQHCFPTEHEGSY